MARYRRKRRMRYGKIRRLKRPRFKKRGGVHLTA